MKDLHLLVWLTQLALSVAVPLAGFPLLALWLQNKFGWGKWVFWVALVLGVWLAIDGFRSSLKLLERQSRDKKTDEPPVSFSEHD